MKISTLIFTLLIFTGITYAQDTQEIQESAKTYIRNGDYANAILVLNRGVQKDPLNAALVKDLALSYYFQKEYNRGLEVIKPILETDAVDDQCYQIAGNFYSALQQPDECVANYKKGIKKFPKSGPMYFEMGELLWAQKKYEAINYWEKGIEKDPAYPNNYYSACKYYYLTTDKIWSIVYGEIFVNMEPSTRRTIEIKDILMEGYKKLFSEAEIANPKEKNVFVKNYLSTMNKQSGLGLLGIHTNSLVMIRTRFVLDWNNDFGDKYPYKLFQYHQQLLQEGLFEAYNQWLFGAGENLAVFQRWTQAHNKEYNALMEFQKGRVFTMPEGQYYH